MPAWSCLPDWLIGWLTGPLVLSPHWNSVYAVASFFTSRRNVAAEQCLMTMFSTLRECPFLATKSTDHLLLQGCIPIIFSVLKLKSGLEIVWQFNFIDLDDFLTSVLIWVRLVFTTGYFVGWESQIETMQQWIILLNWIISPGWIAGLSPHCKSICKKAAKDKCSMKAHFGWCTDWTSNH